MSWRRSAMSEPVASRPGVSVAAMLLTSGPRFARDSIVPAVAFYAGWKLFGLTVGILSATVTSVAVWWWERRRGRPGVGATIGLTIALTQALAGLTARSPVAFFAPGVLINALYGLLFIGSVLVRRPLAGVFAGETYPFPPQVKASATYRRVFSRVSLMWGAYMLVRSGIRLLALLRGDVDLIVAVNVLTGVPVTAALTTWSIWYGVRGFRRSAEWGWALRAVVVAVALLATLTTGAVADEA